MHVILYTYSVCMYGWCAYTVCVYVPYSDTICSCDYTSKRSTCFQNIICKKHHLHVQSYYCAGYNYLYNQKYQKKDIGNVYSLHLLVVSRPYNWYHQDFPKQTLLALLSYIHRNNYIGNDRTDKFHSQLANIWSRYFFMKNCFKTQYI